MVTRQRLLIAALLVVVIVAVLAHILQERQRPQTIQGAPEQPRVNGLGRVDTTTLARSDGEAVAAYHALLRILRVAPPDAAVTARYGLPRLSGRESWGWYEVIQIDGPVRMRLDSRTLQPRSYMNNAECTRFFRGSDCPDKYRPQLTAKQAESMAWTLVRPFFAGQPPANLVMLSSGFSEDWRDWRVDFAEVRDGYESWNGMYIEFHEDGVVTNFVNDLQPCDCPTEARISEAQAIAAARKVADKVLQKFQEMEVVKQVRWDTRRHTVAEEGGARKMFAPVLDPLHNTEEYVRHATERLPEKFRPAYCVGFRLRHKRAHERLCLIEIHIDAITGEYIGGLF